MRLMARCDPGGEVHFTLGMNTYKSKKSVVFDFATKINMRCQEVSKRSESPSCPLAWFSIRTDIESDDSRAWGEGVGDGLHGMVQPGGSLYRRTFVRTSALI